MSDIAETSFTKRGVSIKNISVNVDFDSQTEEALGVISALKFYEANGEKDFGRDVIKAKAAAPKISVYTEKESQ